MQHSATACVSCAFGKYNTESKSTAESACTLCPEGTFGDEEHAIANALITDRDDPDFGSNTCKDCPAGQYSSSLGVLRVEDCKFCSQGRYSTLQRQTDVSVCLECPAGKYGDEAAAYRRGSDCLHGGDPSDCLKSCKNCIAGMFSPAIGAIDYGTCQNCSAGRYSLGFTTVDGIAFASGYSTCTACSLGYYSTIHAATSFDNCTAW